MKSRYLTIAMLAIIVAIGTAFLMLQHNQTGTASNTQAPSETNTSSTPANWILLNWTNTTTPDGVKVTLFVYQVNISQNEMIKVVDNMIEYCENLTSQYPNAMVSDSCRFNPQELHEKAENGRLAVLALVAVIKNAGLTNQDIGLPGPHCGPTFNIDFLRGKSNTTIAPVLNPVLKTLHYNVEKGRVIVGYIDSCEQSLLLGTLKPGDEVKTIYGFLVVKGTKLSITATPVLGHGPLSLDVYVPEN